MGNDKKYIIVLFSNKKKRRVLFKSNNFKNTRKKYNALLSENQVLFPQLHRNKKKVNYELALVTTIDVDVPDIFFKDILGRNQKAEFTSGLYSFIELNPYQVEEKVWDFQNDTYVDAEFIYDKMKRGQSFKQVFTLNNKLFIQKDEDIIGYGLKNIEDCHRLFKILQNKAIEDNHGNLMFVIDFSTAQRKDLYELLQKNGFPKESLYKHYSY
jgi:hypothetical protein